MTLPLALDWFALASLWTGAIGLERTRNVRFLASLSAVSIIFLIAVPSSDYDLGRLVKDGVFVIAIIGLIWPSKFHLASLDAADREVDVRLRMVVTALKGDDHKILGDLMIMLDEWIFTNRNSAWRASVRCYRTAIARRIDLDAEKSFGPTPIGAFQRAGRDYWKLAIDRRIIGRPHKPTAWDEDVLLRCYLDAFDRSMPSGSFWPLDKQDARLFETRIQIEEVRSLSLEHIAPRVNQNLLLDAMEANLEVAMGDLSEDAIKRMRATETARFERWQAPDESDRLE